MSKTLLERDPDCSHTCSLSPCQAVDEWGVLLVFVFHGNFGSLKTQISQNLRKKYLAEKKKLSTVWQELIEHV